MKGVRPLPVVLVGGRSVRFGRDKLREPIGEGMLIDIPLAALRGVFGAPVAVAGVCHADVAARADLVIEEVEPGRGPIGGIVAALEHEMGIDGAFVLAGDLASITTAEVKVIWVEAERHEGAWAVLADSGHLEPCIGIYRCAALPALRERLATDRRSLHDALPPERVVRVKVEAERVRNVNVTSDLEE
jgi:molybdopterin-guanine dinucleotide biosynthesis protein A